MHDDKPGHVIPVLDGEMMFSVAFKVVSHSNGLTPRSALFPGRNANLPNGTYLLRVPVPLAWQGTKNTEQGSVFVE